MAKQTGTGNFKLIRGKTIPDKYLLDTQRVFGYNEEKSLKNLDKHGIDFEEAQALWNDPHLLEFLIERKGETRYGILSKYDNVIWVAIFTYRGDRIRIISVRRATKGEARLYGKENQH